MPDFDPITVCAFDNQNNKLFEYDAPFRFEITARKALEYAFAVAQQTASESDPDPFVFTLEYYGYSKSRKFPGYLGYEVESIGNFANGGGSYWDLLLDDVPSSHGADTTFPGPGSTVKWVYTSAAAPSAATSRRANIIQSHRAQRTGRTG
jgi:hypothetical protein